MKLRCTVEDSIKVDDAKDDCGAADRGSFVVWGLSEGGVDRWSMDGFGDGGTTAAPCC